MLVLKNKTAAPLQMILLVYGAVMVSACTTTENKAQQVRIKIEPSIIAVSTPGTKIPQGARFAWLQNAINLYKDERLDSTSIQYLIEKNIKSNLADMGFRFVESESVAWPPWCRSRESISLDFTVYSPRTASTVRW